MVVALRKPVNILVVDDRDENLMAVEAVLDDPQLSPRPRSIRAAKL
jgi:hypothetical protein